MQSDRNKNIIIVSVIIAISFAIIYLNINYIWPIIGKSPIQSQSNNGNLFNGRFNPFGLFDNIIYAIILLEIITFSIALAVGLPGIIIKYLNHTNHHKSILLGLSTGSLMLLPFLYQEILEYSDLLKLIFLSIPGAYLVFASPMNNTDIETNRSKQYAKITLGIIIAIPIFIWIIGVIIGLIYILLTLIVISALSKNIGRRYWWW